MADITPIQKEFRNAMANLAAAVNIVTTDGPNGRLGLTLTAVCSVTDSPPTVLICINKSSATHDVFVNNRNVAINILDGGQAELAAHFSGATKVPMAERFEWDIWAESTGAPVLRDAHAVLNGRIQETIEYGTHSVMFVAVESINVRDDTAGLVYYDRSFRPMAVASVAPPTA